MTRRQTAHDPRHTPVMLRRELIAQGWTDSQIAQMRRGGQWARPRRGAYVDGAAWRAADAIGRHVITARAVVAQAESDLIPSHITGAAMWNLSFWDLVPDAVHGTRRDGRCGRSEAGVVQHRGTILSEDVVVRDDIEMVSATRLGLELPMVTSVEHSVCFVGELLHRGDTTLDALRSRYESMAQWPHSLNTDLVLRLAEAKCESVGEHRFLFLCWRQQLPRPIPQYEIRDADGRVVARVDFAWPELGVYVEFDGAVKYSKFLSDDDDVRDVVIAEKKREELIHELTGWRCIRVVWAELYRPEELAFRLRRTLHRQRRAG